MALRHATTLAVLIGSAVGAAGWLHGTYRIRSATAERADSVDTVLLQQKIDSLTAENEKLRSLSQGGGEFAIPADAVTSVETQTGLSFLSTPIIHMIAAEELRDRILASLEKRLGPGGLEDRNTAYQLIGWLGMNDRFGSQCAAMRAVGARTWFDETSTEGWVTHRFQNDNIPDQSSLLRLLTRILLQQHFPLPQGEIEDERIRVREAIHSGVSATVEAKFFQDNARSLGFMPLKEDSEAQQLLFSLPPFLQGLASFSAMEGKTYADSLAVRGRSELMKALHTPPPSTAEMLFPYERPLRVTQATLPSTPGEVVLEDAGGALGMKLWLDPLGDIVRSRAMAETLCHDRWRLFATDDFHHHIVWVSEWLDVTAAQDAAKAFCSMAAAHAGSDGDLVLGVAIKTPEGRMVRIDQPTPTSLRFINVADQQTLDAIR
jgi:hypothetical protein